MNADLTWKCNYVRECIVFFFIVFSHNAVIVVVLILNVHFAIAVCLFMDAVAIVIIITSHCIIIITIMTIINCGNFIGHLVRRITTTVCTRIGRLPWLVGKKLQNS
jgi:hypothetical protein